MLSSQYTFSQLRHTFFYCYPFNTVSHTVCHCRHTDLRRFRPMLTHFMAPSRGRYHSATLRDIQARKSRSSSKTMFILRYAYKHLGIVSWDARKRQHTFFERSNLFLSSGKIMESLRHRSLFSLWILLSYELIDSALIDWHAEAIFSCKANMNPIMQLHVLAVILTHALTSCRGTTWYSYGHNLLVSYAF